MARHIARSHFIRWIHDPPPRQRGPHAIYKCPGEERIVAGRSIGECFAQPPDIVPGWVEGGAARPHLPYLRDGVARFELLTGDAHAHHHHLICSCCADIVEIDDCFATELEARVAAAHGFKTVTHKLEFFGVCPDCQQAGHSHEKSKRSRRKPCGC